MKRHELEMHTQGEIINTFAKYWLVAFHKLTCRQANLGVNFKLFCSVSAQKFKSQKLVIEFYLLNLAKKFLILEHLALFSFKMKLDSLILIIKKRYIHGNNGQDMNYWFEQFLFKSQPREISNNSVMNFDHSGRNERGDVPGWVLVVLMTAGLVTGIWTVAAPRLNLILRNSLDSMNSIR